MKRIVRLVLLFLPLLANISWSLPADGKTPPLPFHAKVISISDGDTVWVLQEKTKIKIRIDGIDCPETGQDFSLRAKQRTAELISGKMVKVVPVLTDRYERTVANLFINDGTNVNEILVKEGLCWWYERYTPKDTVLRGLEERARAAKLGLWSRPDAMPPWEYRQRERAVRQKSDESKRPTSPDARKKD
jgi:endonuclease YncB( thermonuclease family)